MDLSLIITTFKRADLLHWGLQSLCKQKGQFEVMVLNDGIEDNTELICNNCKRDIRYIFTGKRNKEGVKWRVPGYAINIGVKQSLNKFVIIACAEMFLVEDDIVQNIYQALLTNKPQLVITHGKDDDQVFLKHIIRGDDKPHMFYYNQIPEPLQVRYPFFMGLRKEDFMRIGGYDEDFVGRAFDDDDFVYRMQAYGCQYVQLDNHVVHLWHTRRHDAGPEWQQNKQLFESKKDNIIRNQNREWGRL